MWSVDQRERVGMREKVLVGWYVEKEEGGKDC
jgi:hypothetical protein